jgi:hypothetical protein
MVMPEGSFSAVQILFNKTIEQCRQLGARGGRAHARNLRLRQPQVLVQPMAEIPGPPSETAHEASLLLDAQFPWLTAALPRRPTLKSQLKNLLGQPQGATLEQIMQLTGWDRDRAGWFRSSLGPGVRVISRRLQDGTRCYFLSS